MNKTMKDLEAFDERFKDHEFSNDCKSELCCWAELCADCWPIDKEKIKRFHLEKQIELLEEMERTIIKRIEELEENAPHYKEQKDGYAQGSAHARLNTRYYFESKLTELREALKNL